MVQASEKARRGDGIEMDPVQGSCTQEPDVQKERMEAQEPIPHRSVALSLRKQFCAGSEPSLDSSLGSVPKGLCHFLSVGH